MREFMDGLGRRRAYVTILVAAFVLALLLGTTQQVFADNIISNTGTSDKTITFNAGTSNTDLKIKVVANTAQSQAGDDQDGCNADDDTPAKVTLNISPAQGLTATPNPVVFDKCGTQKTVTLTSNLGGTYTITASVQDDGSHDSFGVYHLEPFGTVTVIVVDTTPPETTITSKPNNPTASQDASFAYSSNQPGSTFECSRDGSPYATCPVDGISYSGLADGSHTFQVRAIDPSGNIDPTPASFTWTIRQPTIGISSITPPATEWGVQVQVLGTTDIVDLTGLAVDVDWGDGQSTPAIPLTGDGSWTADHTFAKAGSYTITANLVQGIDTKASTTASIVISKRNAILDVTTPDIVTGETKFVASGTLKDASTLEGLDGFVIHFTGAGAPDDVTTQGVGFFGTINIMSCSVGSDPGQCVEDDIGEASGSNNRVLHLQDGKITFPPSTSQVRIVFQQMGATPFTYTVEEYPNTVQQCPNDPGVVECPATSFSDASLEIWANSGGSVIDGVTVYNGIKEISFSPGVDIGISELGTRNEDSNPQDLFQINFDDLATGPRASGFTVDSGFAFAFGVSQFAPENELQLVAQLSTNDFYTADDASATYNVVANLQSAPGVGGEGVQGSGTNIAKRGTTGDADDDGLGDTDEGNCLTRNPLNTAVTWKYAPSPSYSSTADCPSKGGVSGAKPDLYYEVDCMAGVTCPSQSDLDLAEKAVDDASSLKDINAHFHLSDTGLCGAGQDVVGWFDGSSAAGSERCDDFKSIKLYNYGTGTENDGGCTLASNCGTLLARAQAVGYILIVDGINNCGTTGLGELYGRDVMVGTDCIFKAKDPGNALNAVLGTMLHEIGHNNGLGHGGGKTDFTRDDVNCKPNHVSVMNYVRQVPTDAMQAGSASASSAVQWYLGYHRGELRVGSSSGSTSLDESNVLNDKLVVTGTWKNRDRVTTISSFKVLWGDSPAVRSDFTGNILNWDNGGGDKTIDLNGIHDVFINGFQLPACTESPQFTLLQSPPDELVTMRNNMDEFQKSGGGIAALGVGFDTPPQDTDILPEQNFEGVVLLDSLDQFEFLGVKQPLNNIAFGDPGVTQHKKGNTIPVQFNFKDSNGVQITGDNYASYGIIKNGIETRIALITDPTTPPEGSAYIKPNTSTQPGSADYFTWDGSKWSFSMGTKNLLTGGTYAGRIYIHFNFTDEVAIMDLDGDTISYLFKVVKG